MQVMIPILFVPLTLI